MDRITGKIRLALAAFAAGMVVVFGAFQAEAVDNGITNDVAAAVASAGEVQPADPADVADAVQPSAPAVADAAAVEAQPVVIRPFTAQWLVKRAGGLCQGGTAVVSLKFVFFILFVFAAYFAAPSRAKPYVLLAASVFFYLTFKPAAMLFLAASILSVYAGALLAKKVPCPRAVLFAVVAFNIGVLAFSKYGSYLFTGTSIIVPLGISFYTLQAVAYMVDVCQGKIAPERNPFKLFLFLSFFPIIMQGPISRYEQLGPQLWSPHSFSLDALRSGLQLALWGFFKKMVIADRAGIFVDSVFAPDSSAQGFVIVVGAIMYSIQIYADFSGCVDISRGISHCLGIDLARNFNHPYFAVSVQDFWRRWHISLSSWLKDYVYIPLGGSRKGMVRKYLNVLIVFAVSGLWHGTGLNYFIWGLLHGVYQIIDALTAGVRSRVYAATGVATESWSFSFGRKIATFVAVTFAWIFFRAQSAGHACTMIRRACTFNPWTFSDGTMLKFGLDAPDLFVLVAAVGILVLVSHLQERFSVREALARQTLWFRWSIAIGGILATLIFGIYGPGYSASQFIYMQF